MKQLRFATVGAGFWSSYQIAAWQELPYVQCIALGDQDRVRAENLAAIRGIPAVYTDAAEMIDRERTDFLDIVTNAASHVSLVELAASMIVPVIWQKPIAWTLSECKELVEICRSAGVLFAVHENWRW